MQIVLRRGFALISETLPLAIAPHCILERLNAQKSWLASAALPYRISQPISVAL
ncbi:hypothetical protein [Oscillatoria sp. FACHB-1406]|uniref:hypothetical protein n=1 Tax=Oscillatoria sp. FACHB-1406 TaxID=2692846 RepID=UPI001688D165|nr:hypothetical protein [Oscillatoria sp. FACHB-1406]MBD2578038.1 hypothetical protein [Oscillatoria sp. FACHB-1406]